MTFNANFIKQMLSFALIGHMVARELKHSLMLLLRPVRRALTSNSYTLSISPSRRRSKLSPRAYPRMRTNRDPLSYDRFTEQTVFRTSLRPSERSSYTPSKALVTFPFAWLRLTFPCRTTQSSLVFQKVPACRALW